MEVQRDQIDHIVVKDKRMGSVLAVNVAEWHSTTYSCPDQLGNAEKERKGMSVQLPSGSRHSQGHTPWQSGDEGAVAGGLGVACSPVPSPVPVLPGFCVRDSFAALGWPIPLPAWVDFSKVPQLIAEDKKWNRRL